MEMAPSFKQVVSGNLMKPLTHSNFHCCNMTFEQPSNPVDFYYKSSFGIEALPLSPTSDENTGNDENKYNFSTVNANNRLQSKAVEVLFSNEEKVLSSEKSPKHQNAKDEFEFVCKSNRRAKSSTRAVLHEIPAQRRSRMSTATSIGDVSLASGGSSRLCSALPSFRSRSRSMSRVSCNSLDKASIILAANAAYLPSRDRKILELMVSRHEDQLHAQEMNEFVHKRWEEEKIINEIKITEEEEARKRQLMRENEHYQAWRKMKQAAMEKKIQQELAEREIAIMMKAEKWSQLAEEQDILRRELIERRKRESFVKKKSQEFNLQQMEKEREQLSGILKQLREHSLLKASQRRQLMKLQRLMEVKLENESNVKRHLYNKIEVEEKLRTELEEMQFLNEIKDARAQRNYHEIMQKRTEGFQAQMSEREEKFKHMARIKDKLNDEFKEWQQQLIEYRAFVNAKVSVKVQQQLSARLEDLRKERIAKTMHHDRIMQGIQNEENKKLSTLKRKVHFKEIKSEIVARKKDREINQSRAMAWASAELRDKLSKTLNPETFDQKVQRVEMENRLMRRRPLVEFSYD